MSSIKPIPYFKGWTLENFPFIEDDFDMITTYQFMCKIVEYLNKVIANQVIVDENNNLVMEELIEMRDYVEKYLVDMDDVKERINILFNDIELLSEAISTNADNISLLNIRVNNELQELEKRINIKIQNDYSTLKTYIDYQDTQLSNKIDELEIGAIKVYDPTTGQQTSLQIVINNIYELQNKDGITASEFDALDLTATAFDNKEITAKEFDTESKIILTS